MKRKRPEWVKRAAERAEKRSAGEEPAEAAPPAVYDPLDPPTHPGGRPTEYRMEFCAIAANACARGATIAEVAEMLGVARWTVTRWMSEHEAFGAAIRVGREVADERVGFSLYERAVGYSYNAVKIMQFEGSPVIIPYVEHVPPDVGAQKHWLANRQPDKWRDVKEHKLGVTDAFAHLLRLVSAGQGAKVIEGTTS